VDSHLEAFIHNPVDGSFAPLAVQPGAKNYQLSETETHHH